MNRCEPTAKCISVFPPAQSHGGSSVIAAVPALHARQINVLTMPTVALDAARGALCDAAPDLLSKLAGLCKSGGAATVDTAAACAASTKAHAAAYQFSCDLADVSSEVSELVSRLT